MANKETRQQRIEREQGEYLDEAIANNDEQVEEAQAARTGGGLSAVAGGDGATKEALMQQQTRARGAGVGVSADDPRIAATHDEAKQKGWFGFSPTGPGENDHPAHRTGRLGSLGEFDADQPYGVAGTGETASAGPADVPSGSGTDAAKDEATE